MKNGAKKKPPHSSGGELIAMFVWMFYGRLASPAFVSGGLKLEYWDNASLLDAQRNLNSFCNIISDFLCESWCFVFGIPLRDVLIRKIMIGHVFRTFVDVLIDHLTIDSFDIFDWRNFS